MTISAPGFYAPQGRYLRLRPADPELNGKIERFEYQGHRFTNFEMEGSALGGIVAVAGARGDDHLYGDSPARRGRHGALITVRLLIR